MEEQRIKKDLDWGNIGFAYHETDMRYVANYKNGAWDEGRLTADATVTLNECAGIFEYCQEIFEGLRHTRQRAVTLSPSVRTRMPSA